MEHLRLDDEIDKTMVEGYLAAAEDAAMQFLNRRFFADQRVLWIVLLRMKADGYRPSGDHALHSERGSLDGLVV